MNTVGKILVVFVTASSLGFLAFVAALRNGGPDWNGEMRSPELQKEFVFAVEKSGDTPITYSAKHRRTESSVAEKTPILAEAVVKSRKRLEEDSNKKLQELSPQPPLLQEAIKATVETIAADKKGVEIREQNLNDRFQELWNEVNAVGDEFSALTVQTQDVMRISEERREEGYRLANQLDLLRNDKFSVTEQRKVLEDEFVRLEENKRRLQRRQSQLKQQLGEY